jgi:hypothetical protein
MQWVYFLSSLLSSRRKCVANLGTGKVGMSVLTKGLAMDFVRQGAKDMAITSIWPAVVRFLTILLFHVLTLFSSPSNQPLRRRPRMKIPAGKLISGKL